MLQLWDRKGFDLFALEPMKLRGVYFINEYDLPIMIEILYTSDWLFIKF